MSWDVESAAADAHELPVVSVIMATYNCEATLDEAIKSIVGQTFDDWELVVCDDGSCDATREILAAWAARLGSRMTVLLNAENRKLQHSLNRCLAVARGTFVARMDADDVSVPVRLERQLGVLRARPDVDLVGSFMQRFGPSGLSTLLETPVTPDRNTLARQVPFAHATVVARREVFEVLGGYNEAPGVNRVEDIDLWFRFFDNGLSGVNVPEPLYHVREDMAAVRRRTIRNRWNLLVVNVRGYALLGYPMPTYWRPIAQFAKVLVPSRLQWMYREVQRRASRNSGRSR